MDCHMHTAVGCFMAIVVSFPDYVWAYELKNYIMCGLMNRSGPLCSRCNYVWYCYTPCLTVPESKSEVTINSPNLIVTFPLLGRSVVACSSWSTMYVRTLSFVIMATLSQATPTMGVCPRISAARRAGDLYFHTGNNNVTSNFYV